LFSSPAAGISFEIFGEAGSYKASNRKENDMQISIKRNKHINQPALASLSRTTSLKQVGLIDLLFMIKKVENNIELISC
jgi:hypothetical protein